MRLVPPAQVRAHNWRLPLSWERGCWSDYEIDDVMSCTLSTATLDKSYQDCQRATATLVGRTPCGRGRVCCTKAVLCTTPRPLDPQHRDTYYYYSFSMESKAVLYGADGPRSASGGCGQLAADCCLSQPPESVGIRHILS